MKKNFSNRKSLAGKFFQNRKVVFFLTIGLFGSSILTFVLPFLTQIIVDVGISQRSLSLIKLVVVGQIVIVLSRTLVEICRGQTIMFFANYLGFEIKKEFLLKLFSRRLAYFDKNSSGETLQRITDATRVEQFLTNGALKALFGILTMIVFSVILAYYNTTILSLFVVSTVIQALWIILFLKKRKKIDERLFNDYSVCQTSLLDMCHGIKDLSIYGYINRAISKWESEQFTVFKTNVSSLIISQIQMNGSILITELKNILLLFYSASLVLQGDITFGMMLAISYIVGQLNSPVTDLVNFINQWQDAKISWLRLQSIVEPENNSDFTIKPDLSHDINIKNLSFSYPLSNFQVLEQIELKILYGKTTAIVGESGSGKSTLIKLLLKMYDPTNGSIYLGNQSIETISYEHWVRNLGYVSPESHLFINSIKENIIMNEGFNSEKFWEVIQAVNLYDFITNLPGRENTILSESKSYSTGQCQRIVLARALYKKPKLLLLDEATSAIDAINDSLIQDYLKSHAGMTKVIVAHRLDNIKFADQIIVLNRGRLEQIGTHESLMMNCVLYQNLFLSPERSYV